MALFTKHMLTPSNRRSIDTIKGQNSLLMDSILCQMDELDAPLVENQPSQNVDSYLNYQALERNHRYWSRRKPSFGENVDLMTRLMYYKSMRGRVDGYAKMSIAHKEEFFSSLTGDWMEPLNKERYLHCLNTHGEGPRTPPGSPCTSTGVIPTDTSPTSEGLNKTFDSISDYYEDKHELINELAASTKVSVSEVEKALGKDLEAAIKEVNKETLLATLKDALLKLSNSSKENTGKVSPTPSDEMSLVSSVDGGNTTSESFLPPPPPPIELSTPSIIEAPPPPPTLYLEPKYPMIKDNQKNNFIPYQQKTTNVQRSQNIIPIMNLPYGNSNTSYIQEPQIPKYTKNQTPNFTNNQSTYKRKFDKAFNYNKNNQYINKNTNNIPYKQKRDSVIVNNTANFNSTPKRIPTVDLTGSVQRIIQPPPPGPSMIHSRMRMIPPPAQVPKLSSVSVTPNINIAVNQNPFGPVSNYQNGSTIYGTPQPVGMNSNFIKNMKPNFGGPRGPSSSMPPTFWNR
uniref:HMG box domain-containing protein n=1 Tax=Parastrongyloides trichosuri TaxID=131310 RepID=A0A0N4Z1V8_PARTI